MLYLCKPLEEIENLMETILQDSHCIWCQHQEKEKEKDDHHYQHPSGRIGHNNLDQMAVGPIKAKTTNKQQ